MKIIDYGFGKVYFLSDVQFKAACDEWKKGSFVHLGDRDLLLPVPKNPSGSHPDLAGMDIGWSWGSEKFPDDKRLPTWVARQRRGKDSWVMLMLKETWDDGPHPLLAPKGQWMPLSVDDPTDRSGTTDRLLTEQEMTVAWGDLSPIPVDECLTSSELQDRLPFSLLIPSSLRK